MHGPQTADLRTWYPAGRLPGDSLSVRGVGINEEMPQCIIDRPGGTSDWLFMAFPKQILLRRDGHEVLHQGPFLMAWAPDQRQWYGLHKARFLHSWIHASGPALDALAGAVDLPRGEPIYGLGMNIIEACILAMHRELARTDPDPRLVLLQLEVLVREIVRCARPRTGNTPSPWPEIRSFIDEHYAHGLTLGGLARRFRLSPQHLCEGFSRWFGVPPIEYQIRLRLDRARLLLCDRNRTVAEVAAEVGWHDAPHFSRLFRRRCGITPGQLRTARSVPLLKL